MTTFAPKQQPPVPYQASGFPPPQFPPPMPPAPPKPQRPLRGFALIALAIVIAAAIIGGCLFAALDKPAAKNSKPVAQMSPDQAKNQVCNDFNNLNQQDKQKVMARGLPLNWTYATPGAIEASTPYYTWVKQAYGDFLAKLPTVTPPEVLIPAQQYAVGELTQADIFAQRGNLAAANPPLDLAYAALVGGCNGIVK